MTLFKINSDEQSDCSRPDQVRVVETHLGKAVNSVRSYPAGSVIGEITGRVFNDDSGADDYTFDFDGQLLEPIAPFRFLNHSCSANCDFHILDIPATEDRPASRGLYLIAIEDIIAPQELTIQYNWPACCAIRCRCNHPECCGWIVDESELSLLEGVEDQQTIEITTQERQSAGVMVAQATDGEWQSTAASVSQMMEDQVEH